MTQQAQDSSKQPRERGSADSGNSKREVAFDRLAGNRLSNAGILLFFTAVPAALDHFGVCTSVRLVSYIQSLIAGAPDGFEPCLLIWALSALVVPITLYKAAGSSIIRLDREAQELRWTRKLLGFPLPGRRVPFDAIKRVIVSESSVTSTGVDHINPAGGLTTRTIASKSLEAELKDDSLPIVLWLGKPKDKLPKGLSPEGIAHKLGWGYDKTGKAAVPRKRRKKD